MTSSALLIFATSDASASGVPFNWVVLAVAVLALVGAAFAGWRATANPVSPTEGYLLRTNLLSGDLEMRPEPRLVEIFNTMLLLLLALYILFDRAGAWLHIPGTPLFVGELTILVGLGAMASMRLPIGRAIRMSPALKALGFWMLWGLTLLVLSITRYGLDAIRDSALWYYGFAAVLVTFLLISNPGRLGRWLSFYRRLMPWVLLWFPFAIVLNATFADILPNVPFSDVSIAAHKNGNIAVFTAIFLAYIWLVDGNNRFFSGTRRMVLTSGGILIILLAGMQNRGGLVASAIGLALAIAMMKRQRSEFGFIAGGAVVITLTLALATNISIPLFGNREFSAEQLISNVATIIDPGSGSARDTGTTQWRLEIWTTVFEDVVADSPIVGFGPGPDLGQKYGFGGSGEATLRNPHNSHIGVLARMGFVGLIAWAALWTVWAMQLFLLRQRLNRTGRRSEGALPAWLVVSATMILINAVFDPTLEGPQVAIWLWSIFGIGTALPLLYSGFESKWLDEAEDPSDVALSR